MNEIEKTPGLNETLEALRIEVRRIRYLFSISIIILALVLMFVTPVVIRSYFDYGSIGDGYTPNLDAKKEMAPRNMMVATTTTITTKTTTVAASSTPVASTSVKKL
ncbi:MAG: hypothetical protein ABIT47_01415 [Candidatus Paceibacterota bacterium]